MNGRCGYLLVFECGKRRQGVTEICSGSFIRFEHTQLIDPSKENLTYILELSANQVYRNACSKQSLQYRPFSGDKKSALINNPHADQKWD